MHANIGNYDLLHSSRDPTGNEANQGFYYVKATPGGKALLNATLAAHIEEPNKWDQQVNIVSGLWFVISMAGPVWGAAHRTDR